MSPIERFRTALRRLVSEPDDATELEALEASRKVAGGDSRMDPCPGDVVVWNDAGSKDVRAEVLSLVASVEEALGGRPQGPSSEALQHGLGGVVARVTTRAGAVVTATMSVSSWRRKAASGEVEVDVTKDAVAKDRSDKRRHKEFVRVLKDSGFDRAVDAAGTHVGWVHAGSGKFLRVEAVMGAWNRSDLLSALLDAVVEGSGGEPLPVGVVKEELPLPPELRSGMTSWTSMLEQFSGAIALMRAAGKQSVAEES